MRPKALDTGNRCKSRQESDTSLGVTIGNTKIKTKDNNETLCLKVFQRTLFALRSILSACGATRALCGCPSIYRSVEQDAGTDGRVNKCSPEESPVRRVQTMSVQTSQTWTPLNNSCASNPPINPARPGALNSSGEVGMQVAGERFIETHAFQLQIHSPCQRPSHSISSADFKTDIGATLNLGSQRRAKVKMSPDMKLAYSFQRDNQKSVIPGTGIQAKKKKNGMSCAFVVYS